MENLDKITRIVDKINNANNLIDKIDYVSKNKSKIRDIQIEFYNNYDSGSYPLVIINRVFPEIIINSLQKYKETLIAEIEELKLEFNNLKL